MSERGLASIKKITVSEKTLPNLLYENTIGKYSLCTDRQADWYKELIEKAESAEGYRYYDTTLENGDVYRIVTSYRDHNWSWKEAEPHVEDPFLME